MVKALVIRSDQIPTDIEMEFDKLWVIAEQYHNKENIGNTGNTNTNTNGIQKIIQIRNNTLVRKAYSDGHGDASGSGESVITDSSCLMSDTGDVVVWITPLSNPMPMPICACIPRL